MLTLSETEKEDLENMFDAIEQNEGERISIITRGIIWQRLVKSEPISDWDLIVNEARTLLSPYGGIESEAQANITLAPNISIVDDSA